MKEIKKNVKMKRVTAKNVEYKPEREGDGRRERQRRCKGRGKH